MDHKYDWVGSCPPPCLVFWLPYSLFLWLHVSLVQNKKLFNKLLNKIKKMKGQFKLSNLMAFVHGIYFHLPEGFLFVLFLLRNRTWSIFRRKFTSLPPHLTNETELSYIFTIWYFVKNIPPQTSSIVGINFLHKTINLYIKIERNHEVI